MTYFPVNVTLVVNAATLEEAQFKAFLFMPWTNNGKDWKLTGHKYLPNGWQTEIEQWDIDGVDSDEMDDKLISLGYR